MELSVLLSWLAIYAKEHAGTKKQAGNGLALQLVSQLYQLGIIEAHRAPGEKKKIDQVTLVIAVVLISYNIVLGVDLWYLLFIGQEMWQNVLL